jgi:hypothetical protein
MLAPFTPPGEARDPDFPTMGCRGFAVFAHENRDTLTLMPETNEKVRRKSWIVISGGLALAVIAGLAITLNSQSSQLSPPTVPPPSVPPPPSAKSEPAPDAQPGIDPTFLVLVYMDSTPQGARVVRASDGHLLGRTPDTIEFHQSGQPVTVRFELPGYLPVTREVSAASDSELSIVLEPIPNPKTPTTTKPKRSKGRGTSE